MVSHLKIVEEEYIEELKDKSKNENSKDSMEQWKNIFKKYRSMKGTSRQILKSTRGMSSTKQSFMYSEMPAVLITSDHNGSKKK